MSMTCTVCRHPERREIDAALVSEESYRKIAIRYGLGKDALVRHKQNHDPEHLLQEAAEVIGKAGDLASQLEALQTKVDIILKRSIDSGQWRTALMAVKEARSNIELLNRLYETGELEQRLADLEALQDQEPIYG